MSYLEEHGTAATPQSEALPGQVENSAGGYAFGVDSFSRLRRFLILGSEGGSYYAGQRELTRENVGALVDALREDGPRAVALIVEVSEGGLAPKNDQAVFALAYAVAEGDIATKRAALEALPRVCRIGTHLFQFVNFLDKSFRKATGRAKRRAISGWYLGKDPEKLAYQLVKYRNREGWTHRDVLRLAHPKGGTPTHGALFDFACGREHLFGDADVPDVPASVRIVEGFLRAQKSSSAAETAGLIRDYNLPREALLTEHLNAPEVWYAMLESGMPMTAMIRNLATMTRAGVVAPGSAGLGIVLEQLGDVEKIRKARVHPLNVLTAMATYESGESMRGSAKWAPLPQIVDALDAAFYAAFGNIEPSGKRFLLGLDVSGSMSTHELASAPLTTRAASSAMALVTAAVEPLYECVGFTGGRPRYGGYSEARLNGIDIAEGPLTVLPISAKQRLTDVTAMTDGLPFGRTDCALPMLYAIEQAREVDAFVIYTDNETWVGDIHPVQALEEYRRVSGIDARLVVVGMVSNGFSIADPEDPGMLDVVGFDSSAPGLIADYAAGRV